MPALMKLIASSLAVAVLGTALVAAPALADTGAAGATSAPVTAVAPPTDRQVNTAIDALRDVLDAMVDHHALTNAQHDAIVEAVRRADWDGYSIERLGDILGTLVSKDVISAKQRDAILGGVRRSRRDLFRLAVMLDSMVDRHDLTNAQHDAIVDALHRADWDGFSTLRLGDILQKLVDHGVITAAQRFAILDGMRR